MHWKLEHAGNRVHRSEIKVNVNVLLVIFFFLSFFHQRLWGNLTIRLSEMQKVERESVWERERAKDRIVVPVQWIAWLLIKGTVFYRLYVSVHRSNRFVTIGFVKVTFFSWFFFLSSSSSFPPHIIMRNSWILFISFFFHFNKEEKKKRMTWTWHKSLGLLERRKRRKTSCGLASAYHALKKHDNEVNNIRYYYR